MNVLRSFTLSVVLYVIFALFRDFEKKSFKIFFEKSIYLFNKKHKLFLYWEFLHFQSHFGANLLLLAILKKNRNFLRKTYVLCNKTKFWTYWGVLFFQLQSTAFLLLLAISNLFKFFFEKRIFFHSTKTLILNVLRKLTNSSAIYGKIVTFSNCFKRKDILSRNFIYFFKRHQLFDGFEKTY